MGTVVAIPSVILALVAAGSIICIARELTSRENLPDGPPQADGEDHH
ncbi:MAG: hypothetical protein P8X98_15805 [Woeseiaceae bacterium]